jgi:hypothetical protein
MSLTVAAGGHVCGCQIDHTLECQAWVLPVESTILALEGAFSSAVARSILALHPAPFLDSERLSDIQ